MMLVLMNMLQEFMKLQIIQEICVYQEQEEQQISKGISGWNEYVKPYQTKTKFWFWGWQAVGRPREGELFILQRNAYMQYKYSIRRLKRAKYRKTFTKQCLNKWGDEFKEIKKFHGQSKTIQNGMVQIRQRS